MKTSADSKNLKSVKWLPADVEVLENLKELFYADAVALGAMPKAVRTK